MLIGSQWTRKTLYEIYRTRMDLDRASERVVILIGRGRQNPSRGAHAHARLKKPETQTTILNASSLLITGSRFC
jgi:hypothetical protein